MEKKIDKIIDKGINQKKVSIKDIGEIEDDSTIVNGREQSKIEKFLNEKILKLKPLKSNYLFINFLFLQLESQ